LPIRTFASQGQTAGASGVARALVFREGVGVESLTPHGQRVHFLEVVAIVRPHVVDHLQDPLVADPVGAQRVDIYAG
jgi:hypothetical protein